MINKFKAITEVDISPLFDSPDAQHSETDALIANTLETDGAFVATGFSASDQFEQAMTDLMRFSQVLRWSYFHLMIFLQCWPRLLVF